MAWFQAPLAGPAPPRVGTTASGSGGEGSARCIAVQLPYQGGEFAAVVAMPQGNAASAADGEPGAVGLHAPNLAGGFCASASGWSWFCHTRMAGAAPHRSAARDAPPAALAACCCRRGCSTVLIFLSPLLIFLLTAVCRPAAGAPLQLESGVPYGAALAGCRAALLAGLAGGGAGALQWESQPGMVLNLWLPRCVQMPKSRSKPGWQRKTGN